MSHDDYKHLGKWWIGGNLPPGGTLGYGSEVGTLGDGRGTLGHGIGTLGDGSETKTRSLWVGGVSECVWNSRRFIDVKIDTQECVRGGDDFVIAE
jgi:hypothetical protein